MRTYYTGGTIGDAYIILCKLYSIATKEPILCKHFTAYENLRPTIKEIYGLLPNISIEFTNEQNSDIGICGNFEPSQAKKEQSRYNLKQPEYYPEFELGDLNHFNLPKSYVTLQIKAGTHGWNHRNLSVDNSRKILDHSKLPVVIIGEKTIDLPSGNFNILDLRDMTTIKEVINIIKNSQHFYGLLGFLSFVAASYKIMSDLWIKSKLDINAIKIRQEVIEEWRRFLIKR